MGKGDVAGNVVFVESKVVGDFVEDVVGDVVGDVVSDVVGNVVGDVVGLVVSSVFVSVVVVSMGGTVTTLQSSTHCPSLKYWSGGHLHPSTQV